MHVMFPEQIAAGEEVDITTHLTLFEEPLSEASVRYEIAIIGDEDATDWVDATENEAGEYEASYTFTEGETYKIVVHVENDEDLHEHDEFMIDVQ